MSCIHVGLHRPVAAVSVTASDCDCDGDLLGAEPRELPAAACGFFLVRCTLHDHCSVAHLKMDLCVRGLHRPGSMVPGGEPLKDMERYLRKRVWCCRCFVALHCTEWAGSTYSPTEGVKVQRGAVLPLYEMVELVRLDKARMLRSRPLFCVVYSLSG